MFNFKKIVMFLCSISFCAVAFAETITWFIDGQPYTTTTCESGDNITLPSTPSKPGYVFTGWREVVNRGTFSTWGDIPTSVNVYLADENSNRTPQEGDFIIVTNASDYPNYEWGVVRSVVNCDCSTAQIAIVHNGDVTYFNRSDTTTLNFDNIISVDKNGSYYWRVTNISGQSLLYNDTRFLPDASITQHVSRAFNWVIYTPDPNNPLQGTWRFVYSGTWSTNGIGGWKPMERLD